MSLARNQQTLFSAKHYHNVDILKTHTLESFLKDIKPYSYILFSLRWKGFSLDKNAPEQASASFKLNNLDLTPLKLLALPLPAMPLEPELVNEFPETNDSFFLKAGMYFDMIVDVFDNQLAQKNYEAGVPDQENVSERLHGLQAGKIAFLLGLPPSEVIALLFHDIARVTYNGDEYGHANHHLEGSSILAPLGLPLDFTFYHGFAKYLLNEFCPSYQSLISPLSRTSLALQQKNLGPQIEALQKLDDVALENFLKKIMLFRLIDDISKVPELALEKELKPLHRKTEYFSEYQIREMLFYQFQKNLSSGKVSVADVDKQLDVAMDLMRRAKDFSNHPELYPPAFAVPRR